MRCWGGVNVCYPRTNQKLYENILSHGGIISEYPPETEPIAQLFPARNRIISALGCGRDRGGKERSGSLITADFAMEQERIFMQFRACDRFLKHGLQ